MTEFKNESYDLTKKTLAGKSNFWRRVRANLQSKTRQNVMEDRFPLYSIFKATDFDE
jgi:hypothetical protein